MERHQDEALDQRAWSSIEVLAIFGSMFLLSILSQVVLLPVPEAYQPAAAVFLMVAVYGTVLTLIRIFIRTRGDTWGSGLGLSPAPGIVSESIILYLKVLPLLLAAGVSWSLLLHRVFGLPLEQQDVARMIMDSPVWLRIALVVTATTLTPLYEEIVFRGILYPYLLKNCSPASALVLTSLLFAALHFHLPALLPLAVLSGALCLAYRRTGSLWICIITHAVFNSVSILLILLLDLLM